MTDEKHWKTLRMSVRWRCSQDLQHVKPTLKQLNYSRSVWFCYSEIPCVNIYTRFYSANTNRTIFISCIVAKTSTSLYSLNLLIHLKAKQTRRNFSRSTYIQSHRNLYLNLFPNISTTMVHVFHLLHNKIASKGNIISALTSQRWLFIYCWVSKSTQETM